MKLFISWSGERSRLLAEALHSWIPGIINAVEPWISSNDIDPGTRWGPELADELEKTRYGIVCVTLENMNSPWLLFESGALSRYVEKARVVPLLLDNKPSDITGPLAQFQALHIAESEIKKLIKGINLTVFTLGEKGLGESLLEESFELWWPKLISQVNKIPAVAPSVATDDRTERDILEEILILARDTRNRVVRANFKQRTLERNEANLPPPPDNFPKGWETVSTSGLDLEQLRNQLNLWISKYAQDERLRNEEDEEEEDS